MTDGLYTCVPNVSEGRRPDVLEALREAASSVPGAALLHVDSDPDHNRTVLTLAGDGAGLVEAVMRVARVTTERIDLREHEGFHPRIGALDVVPFAPVGDAPMDGAVELARTCGHRLGTEERLPVYLYEQAATRPDRMDLSHLRQGQFEGLFQRLGRDPEWSPDFGPARVHPTAGATAVGARPVLVAFNVNLRDDDLELAQRVARQVRSSSGGFPGVKAMGVRLDTEGRAQVSMNLVAHEITGLLALCTAIEILAKGEGSDLHDTEIVGMVPEAALPEDPVRRLHLRDFDPDERVLERVLDIPSLLTGVAADA